MPRRKQSDEKKELTLDFGNFSDKQLQFLQSKTFYTCYGGARGGGKSHVVRMKAVGMALVSYPGIRILMVRCHYPELKENLIDPMLRFVPPELYSYNGADHLLSFINGSTIKFGHWDGDRAEQEYQGVEYDVIFIDEATQLSERAFNYLTTDIRGVNKFPKRMYLTCNPGGVGHNWVKRLFIDKNYRNDPDDPEAYEDPNDYTFIFARVEDNSYIMESNPQYVRQLANLPEDLKQAYRYGDWDAISGAYFKEFNKRTHTIKPFMIPHKWQLYRACDYGLDMLSIGWFAVDADGRAWMYRHYEKSGLIVSEAAKRFAENSLPTEKFVATYAPPDLWNRQKDTGKTMAEIFLGEGVAIVRSDNNRIQGHMLLKNLLAPIALKDPDVISLFPEGKAPKTLPGIMIFDHLKSVIEDLQSIQRDDDNPNDCAKIPHDVTHNVDMMRYFAINRVMKEEQEEKKKKRKEYVEEDDEYKEDYESFICGEAPDKSYINC